MSVAASKFPVSCPQCGKQLMVPSSAAGKQGRCPSCTHVFVVPAVIAEPDLEELPQLAPLSSDPFAQNVQTSGYQLQPTAPQAYSPAPGAYGTPYAPQQAGLQGPNPYMASAQASAQATQNSEKYNHGMGLEQRAWDMGMLGGLLMMVIGIVWFVVGLYFNVLFWYAPILSIIGLVGFLRGMFTGNIAGGNS